MQVYIASSFRNIHGVRLLAARLREAGHDVLDWTPLAPSLPPDLPPEVRRQILDSDEYKSVFKFCASAVKTAALTIYYGEAGKDASGEACMAYAFGNTVWGLRGPMEAPGTILNGVVMHWFDDIEDLIAHVEPYYLQRCRICGCTHWTPCIDEVHGPCWWVTDDLCSACAGK